MPLLRLDVDELLTNTATAVDAAVSWAGDHLHHGAVLISSSASPQEVAALQTRHGNRTIGATIEHGLAMIASRLIKRGVRRLVVAGGETPQAPWSISWPFRPFWWGPKLPLVCHCFAASAGRGARCSSLSSQETSGRERSSRTRSRSYADETVVADLTADAAERCQTRDRSRPIDNISPVS